jgi:hypothetical protein
MGTELEPFTSGEELEKERRRTSEIFLARVIRIEDVAGGKSSLSDDRLHSGDLYTRTPLIYHRKGFTTVK